MVYLFLFVFCSFVIEAALIKTEVHQREREREREREEKEVKWHYNVKGSFTLEKYNNKGNYIYEKFIIFNYNVIFTVIKMKKSDSKDKDYKHYSTEQNSYIGQDKVHNLINKHL